MKKIIGAAVCLAASAMLLTGCGSKLDGEYFVCLDDETVVGDIEFDWKEEEFEFEGEEGTFSITDSGKLKLKFDDDRMDANYSGKYDYEILDKKEGLIYIEDFAEAYVSVTFGSAAKSVYMAMNSAFVDLDYEDTYDLHGQGVITSDDTKTVYNGSDDFMKPLDERTHMYFSDIEKTVYIAQVSNGATQQVFCASSWDSKAIGAYGNTSDISAFAGMTLQDIYDEIIKDYN